MPYSSQAVVTVPATSNLLTTRATLKLELGLTSSTDDAYLDLVIKFASSAIQTYCNYVFGVETITETFRNSNMYSRRVFDTTYLDDSMLMLRKTPVIDVVSAVGDGSPYVLDTDYWTDLESGILTGMQNGQSNSWTFTSGVIVYRAGYILPDQPNPTLPGIVERACLDLAKSSYTNRKRDPQLRSETIMDIVTRTWATNSQETVGGLPVQVAAQLDPFRRVVLP